MKTDEISSIICTNLIRIRYAKRYSQKDAARVLAISQPSYSRIEKGETDITCKQLHKLALFFKTSITEFYKKPKVAKTNSKKSRALPIHEQEKLL